MTFYQQALPNGLTLIAEHNPQARSVALGYFVKTGSRDELSNESGLSHFLEHMTFNGSNGLSALDVNLAFDAMGAQYNAFTSEENTVYYGAVLPEYTSDMLKLWSGLMRPSLTQDDFETEKKVILEEIELYKDRPSFMLFDWARQSYFDNNLGNSVLGTTESITEMASGTMQAYHQRRYAPNNMVLACAGNFDWEQLRQQALELTAQWVPQHTPRTYPDIQPAKGVFRQAYAKATQTYMCTMMQGYSAQDPKRYAAGLLMSILGDEGNSRLYWSLVDTGLAESVSAGSDESDQCGFLYVYTQTDPSNEALVMDTIRQTLLKLEQEGISPQELERAKNKVATALVFAGDTPMNRLFSMGMSYVYNQQHQTLAQVAEAIMAVTLQDIQDILNAKPFSNTFCYVLHPESN